MSSRTYLLKRNVRLLQHCSALKPNSYCTYSWFVKKVLFDYLNKLGLLQRLNVVDKQVFANGKDKDQML